MKDRYDFSKGKRGRIAPPPPDAQDHGHRSGEPGQMPKPEHLRNWVDLIELRERLNRHWYRKKKGSPPVTYAEVYELIRRLEVAEQGKKERESRTDEVALPPPGHVSDGETF